MGMVQYNRTCPAGAVAPSSRVGSMLITAVELAVVKVRAGCTDYDHWERWLWYRPMIQRAIKYLVVDERTQARNPP